MNDFFNWIKQHPIPSILIGVAVVGGGLIWGLLSKSSSSSTTGAVSSPADYEVLPSFGYGNSYGTENGGGAGGNNNLPVGPGVNVPGAAPGSDTPPLNWGPTGGSGGGTGNLPTGGTGANPPITTGAGVGAQAGYTVSTVPIAPSTISALTTTEPVNPLSLAAGPTNPFATAAQQNVQQQLSSPMANPFNASNVLMRAAIDSATPGTAVVTKTTVKPTTTSATASIITGGAGIKELQLPGAK